MDTSSPFGYILYRLKSSQDEAIWHKANNDVSASPMIREFRQTWEGYSKIGNALIKDHSVNWTSLKPRLYWFCETDWLEYHECRQLECGRFKTN